MIQGWSDVHSASPLLVLEVPYRTAYWTDVNLFSSCRSIVLPLPYSFVATQFCTVVWSQWLAHWNTFLLDFVSCIVANVYPDWKVDWCVRKGPHVSGSWSSSCRSRPRLQFEVARTSHGMPWHLGVNFLDTNLVDYQASTTLKIYNCCFSKASSLARMAKIMQKARIDRKRRLVVRSLYLTPSLVAWYFLTQIVSFVKCSNFKFMFLLNLTRLWSLEPHKLVIV